MQTVDNPLITPHHAVEATCCEARATMPEGRERLLEDR